LLNAETSSAKIAMDAANKAKTAASRLRGQDRTDRMAAAEDQLETATALHNQAVRRANVGNAERKMMEAKVKLAKDMLSDGRLKVS
jgi:hypothetical protein